MRAFVLLTMLLSKHKYKCRGGSALVSLVQRSRCGDLFRLLRPSSRHHQVSIKLPFSGSAAVPLQLRGEQFGFFFFYKWIVYTRIIIFVPQMRFL